MSGVLVWDTGWTPRLGGLDVSREAYDRLELLPEYVRRSVSSKYRRWTFSPASIAPPSDLLASQDYYLELQREARHEFLSELIDDAEAGARA